MDNQNKNLILATALSFAVILVWFFLFPPPEATQTTDAPTSASQGVIDANTGEVTLPSTEGDVGQVVSPDEAAEPFDTPRLSIETDRLEGSISLTGGRIDDLRLKDYRETLDEDADIVTFLSPQGSANAYYALYGWAATGGLSADQVPGPDTPWTVESGQELTANNAVVLKWDNGNGQTFRRTVSVDENYLFSIVQSVDNTSGVDISLRPYGLIRRHGLPDNLKNFFILHEGMSRMSDGELEEVKYGKMDGFDYDEREGTTADRIEVADKGWIGFTDHFWMTTLVPDQSQGFRSVAKYFESHDIYQTEAVGLPVTVAAGQSAQISSQLFAGAKEWDTIRDYETAGIEGFIDSIDWGWLFFLTKPMFAVLHWLNATLTGFGLAGSMGWAIIGLTLLIKAILFPLAYKSYASMAKMRELQPQMAEMKEKYGDDRQKMQQATMELYKKEKVNPASGCLPILLQIPIFFALYKVIFVTLELRHAPWIAWIKDLSAPDPTSILNLFGLLNNATPEPGSIFFIASLGVLPILLGISMWLQQKLNPAPTDPTQQMIFAWMPWVFMFMLGSFASGLVVYWIANNMLTFTQQYLIMRTHGYKPDVFGNILGSFKKKSKADKK
jgi:YidC/Oxa1 family membrane protein insertase